MLLWVNHEFPPSDFSADGRFARILGRVPTPDDMLACMGASVVVLVPDDQGGYRLDPDAPEAWRLSGLSPATQVTGPAREVLGETLATLLELLCSGDCDAALRGMRDDKLRAEWIFPLLSENTLDVFLLPGCELNVTVAPR